MNKIEKITKTFNFCLKVWPITLPKSYLKCYTKSKLFPVKNILKNIAKTIKTSNVLFADYYSELGVKKNATQDEIKKAYFKKVKEYHPDINKSTDATEKFRAVQEAYETLGKSDRRQQYDATGSTSDKRRTTTSAKSSANQRTYGNTRRETVHNETPFFDDDFFNQFFSTYTKTQKFQVQVPITLTFAEAVTGCSKVIKANILSECTHCGGKGIKPGSTPISCHSCGGSGYVSRTQGPLSYTVECGTCHGVGQMNRDPCKICSGSGKAHKSTSITIPIPPGTENGQAITLGDNLNEVIVHIKVEKSDIFKKDGYDIVSDLHVDFIQAILGGEVRGDTIYGKVPVKISAGTSSHHKIRMPGKGVIFRGHKGDHVFNVCVIVPKKISEDVKNIILQLKDKVDMKSEVESAVKTSKSQSSNKTDYFHQLIDIILMPDAPLILRIFAYGCYLYLFIAFLYAIQRTL